MDKIIRIRTLDKQVGDKILSPGVFARSEEKRACEKDQDRRRTNENPHVQKRGVLLVRV